MSSNAHPSLTDLGWNAYFDSHRHRLLAGDVPARVVALHRDTVEINCERGSFRARLGGRMRRTIVSSVDHPAVGDWIGARLPDGDGEAAVDVVLPRITRLVRQSAGRRTEAQIVAANIDLVVVVTALDHDFNVRRLERWAQVVEGSGALPVVLLNKADLCADPAPLAEAAERAVPGARVIVASAASSQGLTPLREAIRPGITAALVGSSGVGKSTTVNALLGSEVQATREVRDHDHRGRHATTHRELFLLPGGGMLVDTPGLRELAAWADEDVGLGRSFSQVDDLIDRCRFRDCTHRDEPGCAVLEAVATGQLDPAHLAAHAKLQKELAYQARRQDTAAARAEKAKWKAITKSMRNHPDAEYWRK